MLSGIHIGKILRKIRKDHSWTQERLATELKAKYGEYVNPSSVSRWETDPFPSSEYMFKICEVFGMHPCDLFLLYAPDDEVKKRSFAVINLRNEELLDLFNSLPPQVADSFLQMLKNMVKSTERKKTKKRG